MKNKLLVIVLDYNAYMKYLLLAIGIDYNETEK